MNIEDYKKEIDKVTFKWQKGSPIKRKLRNTRLMGFFEISNGLVRLTDDGWNYCKLFI